MAASLAITYKRVDAGDMDCSSGNTVLAQLPDALRHFNEVHSDSSLDHKSPRMFRKEYSRQDMKTDANLASGFIRE
jgi:putative transposase